ncbi:sorbitol dehydrogenase [Paraburkholderia sp. Ac-20340]|uniref:sugar dehydrogenase complex small subunit n=1 Tax=Paraburkholderia sp. Ac-20340 TaxID=2703888 RepID=UPI00198223C1|nr:sugar dehydrogenase complex small subunit [Paraburkholderia sp. Ac-20340]MBN3857067.1 sorbitol dehydrogenase [Paraburkholderia sp. Ac-20340]
MTSSQQPPSQPFAPSRRQFLIGTTVLATLSVAGLGALGVAHAQAAATADAGAAADFAAFMKLSQYLTGKSTLDVEIGRAILAGLRGDDASASTTIAQLNDFVASTNTPANTLQSVLDASQPALAKLPKKVVTAWYLGVVGTGKHARTVAYEQALMYPPIADVIVMPSYARGVPGYWAKPPVLSHS